MEGMRLVKLCRNVRDTTSQDYPTSLINYTGCSWVGVLVVWWVLMEGLTRLADRENQVPLKRRTPIPRPHSAPLTPGIEMRTVTARFGRPEAFSCFLVQISGFVTCGPETESAKSLAALLSGVQWHVLSEHPNYQSNMPFNKYRSSVAPAYMVHRYIRHFDMCPFTYHIV